MAQITNSKISLSIMARNFKEDNVSREMLRSTLIKNGFITENSEITEYGLANGISYKYGENNEKWPVYDEVIQTRLQVNIPWMIQNFPELTVAAIEAEREKKKGSKKKSETKESSFKIVKTEGKFSYMGLPEDFLIMDTETTGLSEADEVIELSIVDSAGKELYHSYFYTDQPINPEAAKVNHMTKEMLIGCPKFSDEWINIQKIIEGRIVVGHNLAFDIRTVKQTLSKSISDQTILDKVDEIFANYADTKQIAKKYIESKSYSLNNLTTLIGITREEQHNSTDDCRMTLEFIERLQDILVIKNEYGFIKEGV